MTTDDDRIAYLAGEAEAEVDDVTRADLDELRDLLADPAVWAEPSAGLEDAIVAAIAAEAAEEPPLAPPVVRRPARRHSHRARFVLSAAAAVAVLGVGGFVLVNRERRRRQHRVQPRPDGERTRRDRQRRHRPDGVRLAHRDRRDGPPPPRRRPVLPSLAEGRRRRPRADRDVQRAAGRDPVGRRLTDPVLDADGHRGGGRRRPGIVRSPRPHRHHRARPVTPPALRR